MPNEPSKSTNDDDYAKGLSLLRDTIEDNFDRARDTAARLDKTLISLSAGALVLTTSFVPTFAPQKLRLPLLFLAWLAFVVTMILVIFGMFFEKNATEKAIQQAGDSLRILEEYPTIARQFLAEQKMEKPITHRKFTTNTLVAFVNRWALIVFTIGVVSLVAFAIRNQWPTPPEQIQSHHVTHPPTTTTSASPSTGGNQDRR